MKDWKQIHVPTDVEIQKHYSDIVGFLNHLGIRFSVWEDPEGVYRFYSNRAVEFLVKGRLNDLWTHLRRGVADWDSRETRDGAELYALMGYSLSGFGEVFSDAIHEFLQEAKTDQ